MTEETNKKIKENKYRILRMSLILGNVVNDKESLDNFEQAAREIDAMNGEEYLDTIKNKYYETNNLEEERKKLEDLVAFIEGRVSQRKALEEDFYNVAGYYLSDLEPIKDSDNLDNYKNRLNYINKYLNNIEIINKITEDKNDYQKELNRSYDEKENFEEHNIKLEKDLSDLFKKLVNDKTIILRNVEEIDTEISDINPIILDSKKTLDVFDKSFRSLKKAGISGREEKEYSSYVNNVKEDYYQKMERYFLLSLYRLIFVICSEFENIFSKRNKIREILDDRIDLRSNLDINEEDKLSKLYSLLNSQYEEILKEEEIINNITDLKEKIADCEVELSKYKEENEQTEITDLIEEFSGTKHKYQDKDYSNLDLNIDMPDYRINNNIDLYSDVNNNSLENNETYNIEEIANTEFEEESIPEEPPKDNQIINVSEPTGIDISTVSEKTKNVMIKVGEMLNPKPKPTPVVEEVKPLTPPINVEPILENKAEPVEKNEESTLNYDLSLPDFNDLPTVSSLTTNGSINPTDNNLKNNENSFWGNDNNDFEFPDINSWEE